MPQFVDVLVPMALPGTFTYALPEGMTVQVGSRVLVPFGRKKLYTAIVVLQHNRAPSGYEVKAVLDVLDPSPIVRHPQLKFWHWISDYYMCTVGEVYKAALPSGLKIESETCVSVNPDYVEPSPGALSERERVLLDLTAQHPRVRLTDLEHATGYRNVPRLITQLLDKEAIHVNERVVDTYRPKTEACVRLTEACSSSAALHEAFDQVKRAPKQETLLLAYLDLSHHLQGGEPHVVTREALLKRGDVSAAVLNALVQKDILEVYRRAVDRFGTVGRALEPLPTLSEDQRNALTDVRQQMREHDIVLLHGVTSSGKTSLYMHLIDETLRQRNQVLYLVPEIALTTQLTQRLRRVFGDRMLIYHSRFSDNERVDIWRRLLTSHDPCLVIGVRSSVFLPFARLGLVIVDEEHDSSYKQQDPAPRYNGRNAAMMLARMHGAKTLLGSATPAVEIYYRALAGQYGLVKMLKRYGDISMPRVEIVDTLDARRRRAMSGLFSNRLVELCREALGREEQVILFQNRRGYAPMVTCRQCGTTIKCVNCDVSLTYHKHTRSLTCHYCGYTIAVPDLCPACKLPGLEIVGYGTERIEDVVDSVFEGRRISRMDLDTTRNKNSYDRIIEEFSQHRTDILVGTQMVTKGLDFDAVSVVGILNADTMIHFPDFRAAERAFDMLEQVAGRAGRAHKQGLVVIQTAEPSHPVITHVAAHDYEGFYRQEIADRERFGYPPFTRLVNIGLRHGDERMLAAVTDAYASRLRQVFGPRVLGPDRPRVGRVQNLFIRQLVLKMEPAASMTKVKGLLRQIYEQLLHDDARLKSVRLYFDVDPV